jgi:hypothetical protein
VIQLSKHLIAPQLSSLINQFNKGKIRKVAMRSPIFPSLTTSFSHIRTSFRRSTSASPRPDESMRGSCASSPTCSPNGTIRSIMCRQPSMQNLEEERKSFGSGLAILEPRPFVYWGSMEERMESF